MGLQAAQFRTQFLHIRGVSSQARKSWVFRIHEKSSTRDEPCWLLNCNPFKLNMSGRSSSTRLLNLYRLLTFRPFSRKSVAPHGYVPPYLQNHYKRNPVRVGGVLFDCISGHWHNECPQLQTIPDDNCVGWIHYFPDCYYKRLLMMKNNCWMTDMLLKFPLYGGKYIGHLDDLICSSNSQLVEEYFGVPTCCTSPDIVRSMRDVVSALFILHESGIFHGDIKPEKIFIFRRDRLFACLADPFLGEGVPEPDLKAPEQASAVDMYSFGRVLFFCITRGRHPFDDTHDQLCENIKENKRNPSRVKNLPEAFDLISDLLNPDLKLRLRALDVLNHPFFWNSKMRQRFLKDTTKHIIREMKKSDSALLNELESTAPTAMDDMLSCSLSELFRVFLKTTSDMVNMYDQKLEVSEDAQPFHHFLRPIYRRLDEYTRQYPGLLIYLYKVVSKHCREQIWFKYYCAYQRIKNKKFRPMLHLVWLSMMIVS